MDEDEAGKRIASLQAQIDALQASKEQSTRRGSTKTKSGGFGTKLLIGFIGLIVIGSAVRELSGLGRISDSSTSNSTEDEAMTPPPNELALSKSEVRRRNLAEARSFYGAILGAEKECDQDARYATAAVRSGDVVNLYQNAKAGHYWCADAAGKIAAFPYPQHASVAVKEKIRAARKDLTDGYRVKSYFFSQVENAADKGNMRPSEILEMKNWAAAGAYGTLKGTVGILAAFEAEGLSAKEIMRRIKT